LKQYIYDFFYGNNLENYYITIDYKRYQIYSKRIEENKNNYMFKLKLNESEISYLNNRISTMIENANN